MEKELKNFRIELGITMKEASAVSGIPFRTYVRYENDDCYGDAIKRRAILSSISAKYEINENHGILSLDKIKEIAKRTFEKFGDRIEFCFLFGSYAKGYMNEQSDIDLFLSTTLKGMEFVGLVEELRENLHKKVDVLRFDDQKENVDLFFEVMKDGIKVYG